MFGYVTPLKCELRMKEYDLYKAVYCALCYELQNHFGYFSKLFLNYDFVVAAMLGAAVKGEQPRCRDGRCSTNCLKRCMRSERFSSLNYAAAALCISVYYKLLDDLHDEPLPKKLLRAAALPFARHARKKAAAQYPQLETHIGECIRAQFEVEKGDAVSVDAAADNSSLALGHVLAGLGEADADKRLLQRLGYLCGRFVYLADCADDLTDDARRRRFNPLLTRFSIAGPKDTDRVLQAQAYAKEQLLLTAAEAADCYSLLREGCYKPILDNVFYLGMPHTAAAVTSKRKGKQK